MQVVRLVIVVFVSLFCGLNILNAMVPAPLGKENLFLDDNQLYKFSEQEFSELLDLLKQQEQNVTNAPGVLTKLFDEFGKVDGAGVKIHQGALVYKNVQDPESLDLFFVEDKKEETGHSKSLSKLISYDLRTVLEVEKDNNKPVLGPVVAGGKKGALVPVVKEEMPKISLFNFYKKVKRLAKEELAHYKGLRPMPKDEFDKLEFNVLLNTIKNKKFRAVSFKESVANPQCLEVVLKEKLDGSVPSTAVVLSQKGSDELWPLLEEEKEKQESQKRNKKNGNFGDAKNSSGTTGGIGNGGVGSSKKGVAGTAAGGFDDRKRDDNSLAKKAGQGYAGGSYQGPSGYDSGGYSGGRGNNYGNYNPGGNYGSYGPSPKSGYAGTGPNRVNPGTAYTGTGPAPVSSASTGANSKEETSLVPKITREITHIDSGSYDRKKRNKQDIDELEDYFFGIHNQSLRSDKKQKQPNRYAVAVQKSIEADERKKRAQHDLLSDNEESLGSTKEQKGGIVATIGNVISTCITSIKVFFNWLYESTAAYF